MSGNRNVEATHGHNELDTKLLLMGKLGYEEKSAGKWLGSLPATYPVVDDLSSTVTVKHPCIVIPMQPFQANQEAFLSPWSLFCLSVGRSVCLSARESQLSSCSRLDVY